MQRLTDEELAELERMEKAATPGLWNRRDIGDSIIECEDDTLLCTFPSEQGNEDSNAKFVALSRNALPLLLAEVRELRAAVATEARINVAQLKELYELRAFKARCLFGEPEGGE